MSLLWRNWRVRFTSKLKLAIPEKTYFVAVVLDVGRLFVCWCNEVTYEADAKKLTIINLELSATFLDRRAVLCFIWHCFMYLINTLSMFLYYFICLLSPAVLLLKRESLAGCATFSFLFFLLQFFLHFLLLSELFLKYFLCGEQLSLLLRNWRVRFTSKPKLAIPQKIYFVAVLDVGRLLVC